MIEQLDQAMVEFRSQPPGAALYYSLRTMSDGYSLGTVITSSGELELVNSALILFDALEAAKRRNEIDIKPQKLADATGLSSHNSVALFNEIGSYIDPEKKILITRDNRERGISRRISPQVTVFKSLPNEDQERQGKEQRTEIIFRPHTEKGLLTGTVTTPFREYRVVEDQAILFSQLAESEDGLPRETLLPSVRSPHQRKQVFKSLIDNLNADSQLPIIRKSSRLSNPHLGGVDLVHYAIDRNVRILIQ